MATSLLQITNNFYNIVGETPDDGTGINTVYPLSFVQGLVNSVQDEITMSWKFPFMRSKSQFNTAPVIALTSELETTDTTINSGATDNFPSSGSIYIQGDIISYTGKTDTTFTGVTGIDIDHDAGSDVELLYTLPTDFDHDPIMKMTTGSTNNKLVEYAYEPEEEYDEALPDKKWALVIDKSGNEYIRLNTPSTVSIVIFYYYKTATTMTDVVDSIIPDRFALEVIARTAAGTAEIIRNDNPDDIGTVILSVGERDILKMKNYYSSRLGVASVPFKSKYTSKSPYQQENFATNAK